jgi:hypothetical protein
MRLSVSCAGSLSLNILLSATFQWYVVIFETGLQGATAERPTRSLRSDRRSPDPVRHSSERPDHFITSFRKQRSSDQLLWDRDSLDGFGILGAGGNTARPAA